MGSKLLLAGIIGLLLIAGIFVFSQKGGDLTGNTINSNQYSGGDVQKITLGTKNFNYFPQEITVKSGIPVEITLDETVTGCLRSFIIPEFNVRAYSKNPSDVIKFTPSKKGRFNFSCSMGMGFGNLVVE